MTSIMRYRGCLEHFRKLFDRLRSLEQERDQAAEMLSALQEKVDANELELTLVEQSYEVQHSETLERHKKKCKRLRDEYHTQLALFVDVKDNRDQAAANSHTVCHSVHHTVRYTC